MGPKNSGTGRRHPISPDNAKADELLIKIATSTSTTICNSGKSSTSPSASTPYLLLMSTGHMHVLFSGANLSCSDVEFSFSCNPWQTKKTIAGNRRTTAALPTASPFGSEYSFLSRANKRGSSFCIGTNQHQHQRQCTCFQHNLAMWRVRQSKSTARCWSKCCNLKLRCLLAS